jgi:predicted dehydrogenase
LSYLNKNIVLLGGNFAINVIEEALLTQNHNITHISSSKKNLKNYQETDKNIFFVAIPPAKNLSLFLNTQLNQNSKVFIEKPLSNNLLSSIQIKDICLNKNINLFIDYSFNFLESFKFLFNELKINHETVLTYEFEWYTLTTQKKFKNNWKHLSALGGGGLYNYISHIISVLILNFNDISIVDAKLFNKHLDNYIFNDFCGNILFKHFGGISGTIKYDIFSDSPLFLFSIVTKENTYKIFNDEKDFFSKFIVKKNNKTIYSEENFKYKDARIAPTLSSISSFLLEDQMSEKLNIDHAVSVQNILHYTQLSSSKRKELYVNSVKN